MSNDALETCRKIAKEKLNGIDITDLKQWRDHIAARMIDVRDALIAAHEAGYEAGYDLGKRNQPEPPEL